MKLFAFALAASGCLLMAQANGGNTAQFSGPTLGFVPGAMPSQLQPILGIPGASRLGDPISLPATVSQVYLAPGHLFALAAQGPAEPTALVLLRNTSGILANPVFTPLAHAMAAPDIVAFSPTGQSSVVYSQTANRVQVFTGLPASPRLTQDISNFHLLSLQQLAVSDDAQSLLFTDATSTVYARSQGAAAVPVWYSNQVSGLAFAPGSHAAILCDLTLGAAAILQPTGQISFPISPDGACRPHAASFSADGRTILLACSFGNYVWSVDLESRLVSPYAVPTSLNAFDKLGGVDTFLLSPAGNGTYWLVTWQTGQAAVSFVGAHVAGAGQ
jgi:hypothetical protein